MSTNDQPDELGGHHVTGTGWMYEGPNNEINKEEYLLGKQIGRNFDREGTAGQINAVEYDVAPPSIFASRATHQVDLQRKLMEDPLVAIKKREVEDRKKLMDNPLKMKALQEHFNSLEKKSKKAKKSKKVKKEYKEKKEKKSKLKKHKRGRSESDDDYEARRKKLKKRSRSRSNSGRRERRRRNSEGSESEDEDDDEDLDAKLLAKLQAMERGGVDKKEVLVDDDDSDEYESDDEAEERKRNALMAAGVDPNAIEAPLFTAGKRQPENPNAPEKGKGDWDCLKCGNWNFVRRTECFKCNTKKGEAKAPPKPAMFVPIPIAPIKKDLPTPVVKKRTMQLKQNLHGEEKDESGDSPPSSKSGGAASRPGDWRCQKQGCGYSNFASRSSCNKCSTPKGEKGESAPVRAPYQRREGRATTPNGTLLGSPSPPPRRGRGNSGSPQRRRRSPSRERRRSPPRERKRRKSRSDSPPKRYRGRRSPSTPPRIRRRSPDARRRQESPEYKRKDDTPVVAPASKQLTASEKQAKLAEMMANADWRDEQRTSRVKKQRAEQAKEDDEAKREHDPQFLNRELRRAQENLTMEGRIGAKKHTIQRGVGDMDKNFAKR